jgi:hypothetical protein
MQQRPNIIFITSDQQRAGCCRFEGRPVKTSHPDKMAEAERGSRIASCPTWFASLALVDPRWQKQMRHLIANC